MPLSTMPNAGIPAGLVGLADPDTEDEWRESDHPRGQPGNAGQFGSGGGGGASGATRTLTETEAKIAELGVQRRQAAEAGDFDKADEILSKMEGLGYRWGDPLPGSEEEQKKLDDERKWKVGITPEAAFKIVKKVAKDLGFDASRIEYSDGVQEFELNGVKMTAAGIAQIKTPEGKPGNIRLFLNQLSEGSAAGVATHEIMHIKFQTVLDAREKERKELMEYIEDRKATVDLDDIMRANGILKEPHASYFPIYQQWEKLHVAVTRWRGNDLIDLLNDTDGVTPYSAEYWKGWNKGEIQTDLAVHETLAEMERIKYETGKYPEHGRWLHERHGKTVTLNKEEKKQGQKMWRDLLRLVNDVYEKVK